MSTRVAARTEAAPVRRRLSARGVLLVVAVSLILVAAIAPARNLIQQRAQLAHLREQTIELERQNATLQSRATQLGDPAYLEKLARECLGMVKPGEVAFVTIPRHGAPVPPNC
jgi:cell division protein FtsB